jgi:hypothetical protein
MTYPGFNVLLVRSALYGTTFELNHVTQKLLVTWGDTTPGLKEYALKSPVLNYVEEGEAKQTAVPLSCVMSDGKSCWWDLHGSKPSASALLAKEVRQEHARRVGAQYVPFDEGAFTKNYAELKNRQSAQSYLYMARDCSTKQLQTDCMMALLQGPATLEALAKRLKASITKVTVATLRLWLDEHVCLPMTTELLRPAWVVERSHGH